MKGIFSGFVLMGLSALIHCTVLVVVGYWITQRRNKIESANRAQTYLVLLLTSVFGLISLTHLLEIVMWAVALHQMGLIHGFQTSLQFSFGAYSTLSDTSNQLSGDWSFIGGFEAITGMLLSGLSTAFLFAVIREMFAVKVQHRRSHEVKKT